MNRPDQSEPLFEVAITIDAPAEAVWRALRDRDEVLQWHGWEFDGLESEVDTIFFSDDVVVSADQRTLRVQGGDVFTLTDLGGRTVLRMTRAPRGSDPEWDAYYEDVNEGWTMFMQQLRFRLERHPGQRRRTVQVASTALVPVVQRLLAELPAIAGEKYETTTPYGEQLRGEVWYRRPHQVGATVDSWGDGLLVAALSPASPSTPDGGGMLIATGYGLDDAAVERIAAGWRR